MKKMVVLILVMLGLLLGSYFFFSAIYNQDAEPTNINHENNLTTMTPQIIKLAVGEEKIVGDLTIKNTGEGQKRVMPEGETSYAKLEVETSRQPRQELIIGVYNSLGNPIKYELMEFDYYLITVTDQQFSGDLELSVTLKSKAEPVQMLIDTNVPLITEITAGEAKIIGDLTIINLGGGHKKTEEGDMSFARLAFETPRHTIEVFKAFKNNTELNPDQAMIFDNYQIVAEEVGWNGQIITLKVTEVTRPSAGTTPGGSESGTTFKLKVGENKMVDDLSITNQGGGHKILMEGGDESFAELTLGTPRKDFELVRVFEQREQPSQARGVVFDNYSIFIEEVDWNGESVKLVVYKIIPAAPVPSVDLPTSATKLPATFEIKKDETKTIKDLSITNLGGGHEMPTVGDDVTFTQLKLDTPRQSLKTNNVFAQNAEPTLANAGLVFDNYSIFIEKVGWDGETVKLIVFENAKVATPPTVLPQNNSISGELPVTVELIKNEAKTIGDLTIRNQGNTISTDSSSQLDRATTLTLTSQTEPETIYHVTHPLLGELRIGFKYAGYLIHTEAVSPEGAAVRLRIENNQPSSIDDTLPITIKIKEGETKVIDGLTIFNELSGDMVMNTGPSRLFNQIVLSTPNEPEKKFKLTQPFFGQSGEVEEQTLSFAGYQIKAISLVWGGELTLSISKETE